MIETPTESDSQIWLSRGSKKYAPGDLLEGGYRLADWTEEGLSAVELSVLWHTAGQGEEDFCVLHYERRTLAQELDLAQRENAFQISLPQSPLSYEGQIVKVCWVVRLRGFLSKGRQRVAEAPFWVTVDHAEGG